MNSQADCKINKTLYLKKKQTAGLLIFIHGCGTILHFDEMIRAESNNIVMKNLIDVNRLIDSDKNQEIINTAVYDNGCNLAASVSAAPYNHLISNMKFVIERMHIKNHVRKTCKTNFSCDLYPWLKNLNSEICEQRFSLLLKHKTNTKHMSRRHYEFY